MGVVLNALFSFFKSRDGLVAIATVIVLGIVSHYGTPYNPWINLLARVGNILVFLYILWRVAGKSLVAAVAGRRAGIAEQMDSLNMRRQDAEEQLRVLEARIAGLDTEREAILEESRTQARALRESIIAAAEQDARRIREQASRAAENEVKAARDGLRSILADEIVGAVEEVLKGRLASSESRKGKGDADGGMAAVHMRLIDNALKKVVLH